ncbi:hypothetical protein POM88_003727 [Heracleum sosnowskyi]|uniref:HAT C-terminal dimerisation domain-containing protein n=1 Tax=Heracleum sosnowskyi TaxID=360622 RepID=A0AAD8JGT8_9APIA|nr:hypothetical protein POM88_003727 [Heracleum sosnowskyi]
MYGEYDGDTLLEQIQQVTYELFDEYKGIYSPASVSLIESNRQSEFINSDAKSMKSSILNKVRKFKTSEGSKGKYMSSRPELERYLNEEGAEEDVEILDWWKLNSPRFPVLSRMTRDIIAMPVVQGLICGQDWLRAKLRNDRKKVVNVEESLNELEDLEEDLQKDGANESPVYVSTENEAIY